MKLLDPLKPHAKITAMFTALLAIIIGVGAINTAVVKTNMLLFKKEILDVVQKELNPVSLSEIEHILSAQEVRQTMQFEKLSQALNSGFDNVDTIKIAVRLLDYDVKQIDERLDIFRQDIEVISQKIGYIQTRTEAHQMHDSLRVLQRKLFEEQIRNVINQSRANRLMLSNDIQGLATKISDSSGSDGVKRKKQKWEWPVPKYHY